MVRRSGFLQDRVLAYIYSHAGSTPGDVAMAFNRYSQDRVLNHIKNLIDGNYVENRYIGDALTARLYPTQEGREIVRDLDLI